MVRIAEIIQHFYPQIDVRLIPIVQDDGEGAYLRRDLWPEEEGDAPTEERLEELDGELDE